MKIFVPLQKDYTAGETMIQITNRTAAPLDKSSIQSVNKRVRQAYTRENIAAVNTANQPQEIPPQHTAPVQQQPRREPPVQQPIPQHDILLPQFSHPVHKGQKTTLTIPTGSGIKAYFGWNLKDARCDMDASAFPVKADGKVPSDVWFVFYGQTESPDESIRLEVTNGIQEREIIHVDVPHLRQDIEKIVFVLTIHEAFEHNLNFSMIQDAYIRLTDDSGNELVSFQPEEYYPEVTSLTIGELYRYKGQWKFNPVGNGIHKDLAGQCAVSGVEIGG